MGRPANPTPQWDPDEKPPCWVVRISEPKPPGWPKGKEAPRKLHRLDPRISQDQPGRAKDAAKFVSDSVRRGEVIAPGSPETVTLWWARYFKWRAVRPQAETIAQRERSVTKWILPIIGSIPMVDVTDDDLRRVANHLETAVARKEIKPKRAVNLWAEVSVAFSDACTVNDSEIRVRKDNPAKNVSAPARGDDRQKPFLRPAEIVQLFSCKDVPLRRRRLQAVAAYTAARVGEIRALTPADVDFDAMQITITKQASRTGKVKPRTKTGRARVIPIEPALVGLLRILVSEAKALERATLVDVHNEDHGRLLREDLTTAKCTREALLADDELRAPMQFHTLRDTCLTHMCVRRDKPQDIQWRAGHTTSAMTERYITQARFQAGANFGTPFPPLPECLLSIGSEGGVSDLAHHVVMNHSNTLRCEGGDLNPYRSNPTRT
jgi:integrase